MLLSDGLILLVDCWCPVDIFYGHTWYSVQTVSGLMIVDRKREIDPVGSEGQLWAPALASLPLGFHRCGLGVDVHV